MTPPAMSTSATMSDGSADAMTYPQHGLGRSVDRALDEQLAPGSDVSPNDAVAEPLCEVCWRTGDGRLLHAVIRRSPRGCGSCTRTGLELEVLLVPKDGKCSACSGRPDDQGVGQTLRVAAETTVCATIGSDAHAAGDGCPGRAEVRFMHGDEEILSVVRSAAGVFVFSDLPSRMGLGGGTYVLASAPSVRWDSLVS